MTIYRKGEQCRGYLASFSTQTGFASGFIFTMTEKLKSEVGSLIKDEIEKNNRTLMQSMQTLLEGSVQQIERSSTESALGAFCTNSTTNKFNNERINTNSTTNEDQHKFNTKVIDSLAEVSEALERSEITQAQEALQKGKLLLNERQKHILLADKSEFGWATVNEYNKHELANNSEDEKRIIKSELRAKAQRKQIRSNISPRRFGQKSEKEQLPSSPIRNSFTSNTASRSPRSSYIYSPPTNRTVIKTGSCYSCGKLGHWRNECPGAGVHKS